MKVTYQRKGEKANTTQVSVGVDVHKSSWHVTVLEDGEEVFNGRIPSEYKALEKLLRQYKREQVKVAYEAGPCGFNLHDELASKGIETIVVPPSLIPVESGNRVKTDRRDSRKLAVLLHRDMLKRVHVLNEVQRQDRELLRTRRQLVKHRSDVIRQIKSKLLFHGNDVPVAWKQKITSGYIQQVRNKTGGLLGLSLEHLLKTYEFLTEQIKSLDKEVQKLSRADRYAKRVNLLCSIPGVGILTAMEILVELQDVERFRTAKEIASYIGLTPSEYSTGQYIRQGRITRCGNKHIRNALVESSWTLVRYDMELRDRYMKLKAKKGSKRAIVAIARSLVIRIRKVLLSGEPYRIVTAVNS